MTDSQNIIYSIGSSGGLLIRLVTSVVTRCRGAGTQ
jgi:hypothetical protein